MIAQNYIENWDQVVEYVLAQHPNEACGIIDTNNVFIPKPNISTTPLTDFRIDEQVWLEHDIKAILHSHNYDAANSHKESRNHARTPSVVDQQFQDSTGVEWALVVCDGEGVDQPIWWGDYTHRPPLMQREWINGAQDCLSFIADWYYEHKGIELPVCPHSTWWFDEGEDYMSSLYQTWGFKQVNTAEIEVGDLVMIQMRSDVVNHLGVYVGNGMIAHHLYKRQPVIEDMARWKNHIERIARYVA